MKTKIAIASENKLVTQHFGHCETFEIYVVEDNQIQSYESIANPGHKPGFLPNFLNDLGVNVIVSGGMGGGAVEIFTEKGIRVILGAEGSAKDVVDKYIGGNLHSTSGVCEHNHTS